MWKDERWTLAVVDKIKEECLPDGGRLKWVIEGMPLRPDF